MVKDEQKIKKFWICVDLFNENGYYKYCRF